MGSRSAASSSRDGRPATLTGPLDARTLEARRARNFRHAPRLRVKSERVAVTFVERVAVCSTFYRFPDGLACLWAAVAGRDRPRWPRHSHHDAGIGRTWELKDVLPARRRCYYGKLVKQRPVLVALDVFPAFYALIRGGQRARDYLAEYRAGRLSVHGKRLMDSFLRESPQYTRGLRADTFMLEPSRTREFERAMAELQQGLWIVKTEERYEPSFSYRWDLLERWLPDGVAEGRSLGRAAALDRLLGRYLGGAVYSTPARMARLFGLDRNETEESVRRLVRAGRVRGDYEVAGWPGRWVLSP